MPKIQNKIKDFFKNNSILSQTDFIIMGVLTLIFTILVLFRLGNHYAPNTYFEATPQNRDIVIDFGDYITVEKLHVYLGNYSDCNIALSAFNEVTGEWEIINDNAVVHSVFSWNNIDIYYNLRYLGIVSTDDQAVFNEFVFTGPQGIIEPVNISDYPELFDEQDMFYSTADSTYMDGTMFDEIYYARTGYEFINHLPTYETTHPQLGKCIIALSMLIFGNNPFGWRFLIAIFGIFFVPLMYCFAKVLFKDTFVAAAVGILITFECMHYSLARICTIDTIVAFFIILTYYYMFRYIDDEINYVLLGLSAIAMGCAIATKLTGVYAAVGLAIIFIAHTVKHWPGKEVKRLAPFCVCFFILIPLVLYTLAYIPAVEYYAQLGITDKTISWNENGLNIGYGYTGLIARTLRNTNYMINYHKNLVATHPYQSPAESWPIIYRSLLSANDLVRTEYLGDTYAYIRSSVNYIGNPFIWWAAIPCILFTFLNAFFSKGKDKNAMFLCVAYLAQYIPWFGVNRCIFIYHYYPSMLFSLLMMGFTFKKLLDFRQENTATIRICIGIYLVAAVIMFFIFFPVISGLPVNEDWGNALEWFDTWALV